MLNDISYKPIPTISFINPVIIDNIAYSSAEFMKFLYTIFFKA